MQTRTAVVVFAALALLPGCSTPASQTSSDTTASSAALPSTAPIHAPQPAIVTPVLADVLSSPVPVPATDGKTHLAYELRLTNVLPHDVTLTSVSVLDREAPLLELTGAQLTHSTRVLGSTTPTTTLGAAQTVVVWLDVALDKGTAVPTGLSHLVTVTNPKPLDPLFTATQTVNVATVTVSSRKPVAIKPPLAGPNWVDADGCCGTSAHRAALNPIDGQLWAAQRFAIDYLQLDADRRLTNGPADRLDSYAYFGADIHAVGDGTVVGVVDGLPEQVPTKPPSGLPLDQFPGNHVVQDLGGGNYALYAHMKTGTVKVKPGDRLTPGQVIGSVGNTGNSTAPHLHFHVMNTPDPLRSDGLPFVFDDFRLTDRIVNPDDVEAVIAGSPAAMQPSLPARDETGVMPLELDVMTYANR
jgi:hypothetical protein